jgi:hypothetical protein
VEPKSLELITRKEWIKYRWQEIQSTFGDPDRIFIPNGLRTPEEAYSAMEQWDATEQERLETEIETEQEAENGVNEYFLIATK